MKESDSVKKKLMTLLLSLVMSASITVPAFAADEWVTSKDKWGYEIYVKGNGYLNNEVSPLSECPKMDYVKTIDGVTFSNYIRHTTAKTTDYAENPITI